MDEPRLGIEVAFRSDAGRTRSHNEDFVGYYEPQDEQEMALSGRLYVVADGVGGAAAGEVASQYAVRKVLAEYYASQEPDPEERLVQAVASANADIYRFADRRPHPMATTLVAALVLGNELIVANVGDSRAYLVRAGAIRQVTEDHSLTAQMVRQGKLSAVEARSHPKRNLLMRTVGGSDEVKVDVFGGPLLLGDKVVLCTDGLTRYASDDEITQIVCSMRPQQAVDRLVLLANERGGKDNITALVLHLTEADDDLDTEPRGRAFEAPGRPDLEALEQTLAARHVKSLPRLVWPPAWLAAWPLPPMATGAVVALVVGVALLILGALLGAGGGPEPEASTPLATRASVAHPTETPAVAFELGAGVRFVAEYSLYESPSLAAEEVFAADVGQPAQILGGPVWSDVGTAWWLLSLTPPDGQPVTGWVVQSVLDKAS